MNGVGKGNVTTGLSGPYVIGADPYDSSNSDLYWNFGNPSPGFGLVSGNADDNGYGRFEYAPSTGFLALCSANMATEEYVTSGTFTANAQTN